MGHDLPSDVMVDIFSRLPFESVEDCKLVCKSWRKVTHHPSFSKMYTNLLPDDLNSSGKISFILSVDEFSEQLSRVCRNLYYLEYDHEDSSHSIKKLVLEPPFESYRIVGSCNGLVCIIGLPKHYIIDESTGASYVYICNPRTKESITFPELDTSLYHDLHPWMLYGFGYIASSNEYKVVRLYSFCEEPKFAHIEVYTLGSGKGWRNAGKIDKDLGCATAEDAVFVDGLLFWNFKKGRIVAFDLANEIFVELDEYYHGSSRGGVLGGHYRGIDFSKNGKYSDVWLLKKTEDDTFRWSKEFSLITIDPYTIPLALTSSGTVLCADTKIHLYDPKSCSSKMLMDFFSRSIHHGVPHINTFISLKAFGEENMELEGRLKQLKLEHVS